MPGGKREGAGRKSSWIRGKTTVIRVPEALADEVLRLAHLLDEGKPIGDITQSKYLDLSGIPVCQFGNQPGIVLKDLLRKGFKIRPLKLVDRLRREIDEIS